MSSSAKRETEPSQDAPSAKRLRRNYPSPEEEEEPGEILYSSETPAPASAPADAPIDAQNDTPDAAPTAAASHAPVDPPAGAPFGSAAGVLADQDLLDAPAKALKADPAGAASGAPRTAPDKAPTDASVVPSVNDLPGAEADARHSTLANGASEASHAPPNVTVSADATKEQKGVGQVDAAVGDAKPADAKPADAHSTSGASSPSTLTFDSQPWPGYAPELTQEWADKPWGESVCLGAEVSDRALVDAEIAQRKERRDAAMAWRQRRKADADSAGLEPPTVPVEGCSSLKHYDLSDTLGEGTFGVVVRGRHRVTGQAVALKKLTVHDAKDGLALTSVREIKFLKSLRHPAIVPIVDMVYAPRMAPSNGSQAAKDDTGEIYMVEPYMDHDLAGLLGAVSFTIPQIKLYIKQFLEGVAFLHSNAIVHRDIKSANLLISNSGHLQIADFGLARSLHHPDHFGQDRIEYTGTVVTRWYRPPELLAGDRFYGPEVDLWGVGCILVEMFLRRPLFTGNTEVNQLELIAQLCGSPNEHSIPGWNMLPGVRNADATGRIEDADLPGGQLDFGTFPRILRRWLTLDGPIQIPSEAADLVDGLLQLNPAMRTPASKAIDHDWLWSAPLPANPASLPQYPSKKELDRKRQAPRPIPISQPLVQAQVPPQPKPRYAPPVPIGPGRPRSSLPANPTLPARPPSSFAPPPRWPGPGGMR